MQNKTWQPVTIPAYDPKPPRRVDDIRDKPVEFVLTPAERDRVALAKVALEDNRRRQNRLDDAKALAAVLESAA